MSFIAMADAFDTEKLLACVEDLKSGKAVEIPNYDFKSHTSVLPARKVIERFLKENIVHFLIIYFSLFLQMVFNQLNEIMSSFSQSLLGLSNCFVSLEILMIYHHKISNIIFNEYSRIPCSSL